jgi:hypothetical protein
MDDSGIDLGTALTVLSGAFGVWAWVVAWGVSVIRKEVQDMRSSTKDMGLILTSHIHQTERRLTMLETEFGWFKTLRAENNHD